MFTRSFSVLTGLSTFLTLAEYNEPLLGQTYKYFFIGCSFAGLTAITILNIYGKRVAHKVYIKKTGDFVKIRFFNAFWKPRTEEFHVNEMNDLRPSYAEFYRFESVSLGNMWICLNQNLYRGNDIYERTLLNCLDGQMTDLNHIEKKANKFKLKKEKNQIRRK